MKEIEGMQDELSRAKQEILRSCPSASHVILAALESRVEVVRCRKCRHYDEEVCWRHGLVKRSDGYCDEGVERG